MEDGRWKMENITITKQLKGNKKKNRTEKKLEYSRVTLFLRLESMFNVQCSVQYTAIFCSAVEYRVQNNQNKTKQGKANQTKPTMYIYFLCVQTTKLYERRKDEENFHQLKTLTFWVPFFFPSFLLFLSFFSPFPVSVVASCPRYMYVRRPVRRCSQAVARMCMTL